MLLYIHVDEQAAVSLCSCMQSVSQQWSVYPLVVFTHPFISRLMKYNSGRHSLPKIWSSWFVETCHEQWPSYPMISATFLECFSLLLCWHLYLPPSSVMLSQPLKLSDRPFLTLKTSSFHLTPPHFLKLSKKTKCLRWNSLLRSETRRFSLLAVFNP